MHTVNVPGTVVFAEGTKIKHLILHPRELTGKQPNKQVISIQDHITFLNKCYVPTFQTGTNGLYTLGSSAGIPCDKPIPFISYRISCRTYLHLHYRGARTAFLTGLHRTLKFIIMALDQIV